MEGYSVTEAASILGVPTERVWELLARGVLSGAAEGETGMRVYLQPRPAPAPPVAESARPNGDAGQREPERELSPFRELLTEFRNLTERYGQALLALGEARGEVAALRSRVDLLEARMDLRLPMGGGMPAPTPWPAPTPEPMARPPADDRTPDRHEEGEAEAQPESVDSTADEDRPSRRRRSARHATESFAEALARAEDPTRPELPGAADAAAALAALRAESSVEQPAADAALPRELPAAEPMPTLDEPHQATAAEPVEAPEAKAEPEPEPEPVTTAEQPEAAPVAEEPVAVTEPELEPEPEPEAQPAPAAEVAAPSEPLPDAAPLSFDPDRYTVAIEEPDWWVEEATSETPPGEQETQPPSEDARSTDEPAEDATVEAGEAAVADAGDGPADEAAPSDRQEETMLWLGDVPEATRTDGGVGADEMEVVGGSPRRKPLADLPGSSELDEAMAALDAIAGRRPALAAEPEPPSAADSEPERPPPSPAWPMADRSAASPSSAKVVDARLTSTPASRAYRRLRRIFPG